MDLREAIRDELKAQERSVYWLAKEMQRQGVCTDQHVYRFLRGASDVSAEIMGKMLDAVGLELKRKRK